MKKLLVLALLFVSAISNAGTLVECKRHDEVKGVLHTQESDWQLACFNHYKSPDDLEDENIKHPGMDFNSDDDLDPHCYSGEKAIRNTGGNL